MITKDQYTIKNIDDYYTDELYQLEVESKGCLFGVLVETKINSFELSFYDTERFKQDIDDELIENNYVYEFNVILLNKVNLKNIVNSIDGLWKDNEFQYLVPK